MKNLLTIISLLVLTACISKNKHAEVETLPKDVSLKPEITFTQEQDRQHLATLIKEIDSTIGTTVCTDATEWKFTAIGAKPCGGPSSYIAYPKKMEMIILPKIEKFSSMQAVFNRKYNLMSDCAMVPPPVGIKCEEGKAILEKNSTALSLTQ